MSDNITLLVLKIDPKDCQRYISFSGYVNNLNIGNSLRLIKEDNMAYLSYREVKYEIILENKKLNSFNDQVSEFISICEKKYHPN